MLRDFDAGLARYLIIECKPIRKKAATRFCVLRNNAGRLHAIFVRAARRFCSGILHFFRASWAQNLRDSEVGRLFDSDMNAMLTRSTLSEVVQYL